MLNTQAQEPELRYVIQQVGTVFDQRGIIGQDEATSGADDEYTSGRVWLRC